MSENLSTADPFGRPTFIINVPDILGQIPRSPNSPDKHVIDLSGRTGLNSRVSVKHVSLPPGTRLSAPLAHSHQDTLVTCLSGQGLVWQNGWTYPFGPEDTAGWKGGTGIPHTIINEGGPDAEDLVLLIAEEIIPEDVVHYPLGRDPAEPTKTIPLDEGLKEIADEGLVGETAENQHHQERDSHDRQENPRAEEAQWMTPPRQNEMGPHPAVPRWLFDGTINDEVPGVFQGPRPSTMINALADLEPLGSGGDMYALGTSLSEGTGLSGRIGINLEVGPPGTRSSDAHAHSMEDELVYVLAGEGLVWINGYVHRVAVGDVVGFPAGTGIAHVFINDSNVATSAQNVEGDHETQGDGEGEGAHWVLWIFGENKRRSGDRIFYPLRPEKEQTFDRWWDDCPYHDLGRHPGVPANPRRDQSPESE